MSDKEIITSTAKEIVIKLLEDKSVVNSLFSQYSDSDAIDPEKFDRLYSGITKAITKSVKEDK